jgi:RNA polymerase sigma-70 factor, ECF subfamily
LLDELSPRQKEIFQLSREEGLSHKEIAEKLGISNKYSKKPPGNHTFFPEKQT